MPAQLNDLLTTPNSATKSAKSALANLPATDAEAGRGELNNAASWDDFPNGRFGDYKSPAFGAQGLWGGVGITVSLKLFMLVNATVLTGCTVHQRSDAFAQWGHPKTIEDLTTVFLRHLHSEVATTPFSSEPLSSESQTILTHLEKLTQKGWWTICSQPAVDGAHSSDETVGWGPRGGYVFQKAFVEFFAEEADIERIEKKVRESGRGWVDYFAGNLQVRPRLYYSKRRRFKV